MEVNKAFKHLNIEKTKDEQEISSAYRVLLVHHNPEDDAEGFKKLRQAYETAINYARHGDEEDEESKEPLTGADIWMKKVEQLYNRIEGRYNVELWREILSDDVCTDLDSSEEAREKLLAFTMQHYRMSNAVWQEIDKTFRIVDEFEELKEIFPEDYLDYVKFCIEKDTFMKYELLECTCLDEEDAETDKYIDEIYGMLRRVDAEGKNDEELLTYIDKLADYGVYHPIEDVYRIKIYTEQLVEAELAELTGKGFSEAIATNAKKQVERLAAKMQQIEAPGIFVEGYIAHALWWAGKKEEACNIYSDILKEHSGNYQARLGLARDMYDKGDVEAAADDVDEMLQTETVESIPGMSNFLKQICISSINLYRRQLANGETNERHPGIKLNLELAWKLWQNEEPKEALKVVEEIVPDEEHIYNYENIYSRLLFTEKRYKEALPHLLKWSELLKNLDGLSEKETKRRLIRRGMAYAYLAETYFQLGNNDLAEDNVLKAIENEKNTSTDNRRSEISYKYQYAFMLCKWHRYAESVKQCEEIIAVDDMYYPAYLIHQESCYELDRVSEVIEDYRLAADIAPQFYRPYMYASIVFYDYRQYDNGLEVIKRARENGIEITDKFKLVEIRLLRKKYEAENKKEELEKLINTLEQLEQSIKPEQYNEFSMDSLYKDNCSLDDIYCEKALVYECLGDFETALCMMDKAIGEKPKEAFYHLIKGDMLSDDNNKNKKLGTAILHYKKAEECGITENAWLYFSLGYCYENTNDKGHAIEAYKRAIEISDNYATVYERLINIYIDLYESTHKKVYGDAAIKFGELQVEKVGRTVRTLQFLGKAYEYTYRFEEAGEVYEEALKEDTENDQILLRLGNYYRRTRRNDEAIEVLQKCISIIEKKEIKSPYPYRYLAMVYDSIANYEKAIEYYEKECERTSYKTSCYENICDCYISMKQYDKAIEVLKNITEDSTAEKLADVYWEMGEHKKAEDILEKEFKRAVRTSDDYGIGQACMYLPDFYQEKAMNQKKCIAKIKQCEAKTQKDETKFFLSVNKIRSCFISGDLKKARKYALEAEAKYKKISDIPMSEYVMASSYSAIHLARAGWICAGLGKYEEAEKYFKRMNEVPVCNSCRFYGCYEADLYLGIMHMALGKRKLAKEEFDKALVSNPTSVFVKNMIAMINGN